MRTDDLCTLFFAISCISPSCKLDGGLPSFHTSIHRKDAIISKVGRHEFHIMPEAVVVERTRCERHLLCLLNESPDDLGVAMPLVHSGVG